MQLNKITFAGNAGSDAEIRTTKGGIAIGSFNLAYTEKPKDGGEPSTLWMTCKVFNEYHLSVASQIKKGDNVIVEGRLKPNSYTNKEGKLIDKVELIVSQLGILQRVERDTAQKTPSFIVSKTSQAHTSSPNYFGSSDHLDVPF